MVIDGDNIYRMCMGISSNSCWCFPRMDRHLLINPQNGEQYERINYGIKGRDCKRNEAVK